MIWIKLKTSVDVVDAFTRTPGSLQFRRGRCLSGHHLLTDMLGTLEVGTTREDLSSRRHSARRLWSLVRNERLDHVVRIVVDIQGLDFELCVDLCDTKANQVHHLAIALVLLSSLVRVGP